MLAIPKNLAKEKVVCPDRRPTRVSSGKQGWYTRTEAKEGTEEDLRPGASSSELPEAVFLSIIHVVRVSLLHD